MNKRNIELFKEQIFRRIGYTVGLWDILKFTQICLLLKEKGALDAKEFIMQTAKKFDLKEGDAKGKLDVARSLGLLFSIGNRYALSSYGRALLAISTLHGPESIPAKAFYLKRIIDRDADLSLTLFLVLSKGVSLEEVNRIFPEILNDLLKFKRDKFSSKSFPLMLKKEIDKSLVIRESRERASPFKKPTLATRYECIEIPEESLPHYLRHTISPRKGWLIDLDLLRRSNGILELTEYGNNLMFFLKEDCFLSNNFILIEPDEDILKHIAGGSGILTQHPINENFYNTLLSRTYSGKQPEILDIGVEKFLQLITDIYNLVKLETFEQADVKAIREGVLIPYVIKSQVIPFDKLLEKSVRTKPSVISRLSSRKEAGAYISIKRH